MRSPSALSDVSVKPSFLRTTPAKKPRTARNLFALGAHAGAEKFEVSKTEAEWKQVLTPEQFQVLRQRGTERPYSSALDNEHRPGLFACAACDLPLFRSETKFDGGTGWPSGPSVMQSRRGY
jgi:peptide-methionine (R)-S-oxide reductase